MATQTQPYHPGLEGVIAGETAISTIEGGLRYRGYPIEQLAEQSNFEEVGFLVLNGELPSNSELAAFSDRMAKARAVPDSILKFYESIPNDVPAMDVIRTGVSAVAHHDRELDTNDHAANVRKAERILAVAPTLIAARSRLKRGLKPLVPRTDLSHAANLLYMVRGDVPQDIEVRAMDTALILYAEHEFNASTFTARVTASTLADLHSAIVAGVCALKGPLHGGANERAVEVIESVGSAANAESWIRDALARKERIMGFGHRVYKTGDPRAVILKRFCEQLAPQKHATEWEEIAGTIERIIWEEKKLPQNMDWPAGRLFHMLGLETELYTPIFVASRISGWAAHVIEQHDHNRLIRPRANYTGPGLRQYVPVSERS